MGEDDLAPARVSATSHGGQALKSSIKLALMRFLGDYTDDVLVECVARLSSRPSVPCCREGVPNACVTIGTVRWVAFVPSRTHEPALTPRGCVQVRAGDGGARKDPPGDGGRLGCLLG